MAVQTHYISLSGMTYRNEEHIFIGDPRERLASLEFLRQELLPTDHQNYQVIRLSTIIRMLTALIPEEIQKIYRFKKRTKSTIRT